MLHNLYNDIFDKHEFFGNCSFDGCKPATVFLIIFVLMVYFDICSLIMFQSKKKKKEKKNPLDWEQLMYYTTVCPLMARVSIKQDRKWKQ